MLRYLKFHHQKSFHQSSNYWRWQSPSVVSTGKKLKRTISHLWERGNKRDYNQSSSEIQSTIDLLPGKEWLWQEPFKCHHSYAFNAERKLRSNKHLKVLFWQFQFRLLNLHEKEAQNILSCCYREFFKTMLQYLLMSASSGARQRGVSSRRCCRREKMKNRAFQKLFDPFGFQLQKYYSLLSLAKGLVWPDFVKMLRNERLNLRWVSVG